MSEWARWRLKSPASRLFIQLLIQAEIKENFKAPRHWSLWREFTSDRWISHTKDEYRRICFHLITSSCSFNYLYLCELWLKMPSVFIFRDFYGVENTPVWQLSFLCGGKLMQRVFLRRDAISFCHCAFHEFIQLIIDIETILLLCHAA